MALDVETTWAAPQICHWQRKAANVAQVHSRRVRRMCLLPRSCGGRAELCSAASGRCACRIRVPCPLRYAGLARCPKRQCCSQYGRCDDSCTSSCQCEFSGRGSTCPGSMLLSTGPDDEVPLAPPAGVCGSGVATCPQGQCCTVFGFCATNCTETRGERSPLRPTSPPPGSPPTALARRHGPSASPVAPAPLPMPLPAAGPKPRTRRYSLTAAWKVGAPDGFRRRLIAINGRMPGPTLRCVVGDRLIIRVHNKVDAPMTLHW